MTREELEKVIQHFKSLRIIQRESFMREGFDVAIKALELEPIIDKIRAEILEEKECAYADFERYKVEYLGQDPEDVLDSLPQDEFRYGMERTIEIIDKYKRESEG